LFYDFVCNHVNFLNHGFKNVVILSQKKVLFVALHFDSEHDFELFFRNATSGQGHDFKQLVMLTLKKNKHYRLATFLVSKVDFKVFVFRTILVVETTISSQVIILTPLKKR
jgi:hypothetical protein